MNPKYLQGCLLILLLLHLLLPLLLIILLFFSCFPKVILWDIKDAGDNGGLKTGSGSPSEGAQGKPLLRLVWGGGSADHTFALFILGPFPKWVKDCRY